MNATGKKDPIKTWARACTIIPEFVVKPLWFTTARRTSKCMSPEEMVGHKLGEFSLTRTFRGHSGKKVDAKK